MVNPLAFQPEDSPVRNSTTGIRETNTGYPPVPHGASRGSGSDRLPLRRERAHGFELYHDVPQSTRRLGLVRRGIRAGASAHFVADPLRRRADGFMPKAFFTARSSW